MRGAWVPSSPSELGGGTEGGGGGRCKTGEEGGRGAQAGDAMRERTQKEGSQKLACVASSSS